MDPNSIPLFISLSGLAVSAIALAFTALNSFHTRRYTEISTIFEIWSRYEHYAREVRSDGSDDAKRANFLNLLNYIENVCYIYNKRRASKRILQNISALVSDFITIVSALIDFENTLRGYGLGPETFTEIRVFCCKNRELLAAKGFQLDNSIYGPRAAESTT